MSEASLNDSREAIEILSEKDKKIANLKRQLEELRARNLGLENCVKNQDSAVRKIGSLVVSPRSTSSSDIANVDGIEDVIDDVYRKIRRMEDIDSELASLGNSSEKRGVLNLKGELEIGNRYGSDKTRNMPEKKGSPNERDYDYGGKNGFKKGFSDKVRRAEGQIFASEKVFRQMSKEKPLDEKILNLRLDQLRTERDTLYDIVKQYEPVLFKITEKGVDKPQNRGRLEIEATVTLQDKRAQETERQELLYHIEELRKCLQDIKDQKSKKKQKGQLNQESIMDFNELKAKIDKLEAESHNIGGQRPKYGSFDNDAAMLRDKDRGSREREHIETTRPLLAYENKGERGTTIPLKNPRGFADDTAGVKNLEGMRRLSLTAEKPGVLNDSSDGQHVTRVLSERIQELEKQENENRITIATLQENLEDLSKIKEEDEKEKGLVTRKMKELAKRCNPNEGPLELKDESGGTLEMVGVVDQCIQNMKEELLKSRIENNEIEEKLWQVEKQFVAEKHEKENLEQDIIGLQTKDQENCIRIDSLNEDLEAVRFTNNSLKRNLEENKKKFQELGKEMELLTVKLQNEKERAESAESNFSSTKSDLDTEKENAKLFRNMLQELEKTKKAIENDLQVIKSEYENSMKNNSEIKAELQKERKITEGLRRRETELENDQEELKDEIELNFKEMEDLRYRLKRTKEDLDQAEKLKLKLEEVHNQNEKLRTEGIKLENELSDLEIQLQDQKKTNKELERGLVLKKDELTKANKTIDDVNGNNKRLQKSQDSLRNDIAGLRSQLTDTEANVSVLHGKLNQRNEEVIESQREISKEREKFSKAKEELMENNEKIRTLQKEISDRNNQNEILHNDLRYFKEEKEALETKLEDGEEALKVIEIENNSLKLLAETLESEKNNLKKKLKAEEEKITELQDRENALNKKNQALKNELANANEDISGKEREILEATRLAENKGGQLEEALRQIKSLEIDTVKLEKELTRMNEENQTARTEQRLLRERLLVSERDFKGIQKSLESSWKDRDGLQKALLGLENDKQKVLAEVKFLKEDLKNKDESSEKLFNDNLDKGNKICVLNQTLAVLNEELQGMKNMIKEKDGENSELKSKIAEKEGQLKNHRAKNNSLLENISQKNKEIDHLRNKVQSEMKNTSEIDAKNTTLNREIESLKSKHSLEMKEKDGKIELLTGYQDSLKRQLDSYKQREMRLQENGNQMKTEIKKLTDELKEAKIILHDFQATLLDKDNDLKKINDAVMLLENAYATRQAGLQNHLSKVKDDLDTLSKENKELGQKLLLKENDIERLKTEKEDFLEKIRNDAKAVDHIQQENDYMHNDIVRMKRDLVKGNDHIKRKEHEVNELKNKMAEDGKEVEELIEHLDGTLRDVRKQLAMVEDEKINLKAMTEMDQLRIHELEDLIKIMKHELKQKDDDLVLVKAKRNDLLKKIQDNTKEKEDRETIDELKKELFKMSREKQAAVMKLTKERDEAMLQRTAEKMAKENITLQIKNMKDEIINLKKNRNEKSNDFDKYVEELKRRLVESRNKEKEAVTKEADYKLKLKEMSGTVRILEDRIQEAVRKAEEEKKRREEILEQLLIPLEEVENGRRGGNIDYEKWKKRANNLHTNIEDFKDKFSEYKNKTLAENEAIKGIFDSKRQEELTNLKKELDVSQREKLAMEKRVRELSSELNSVYDKKQKTNKDNQRLSEELRLAKQEALIQRHELDWLRDAVGKYGVAPTK